MKESIYKEATNQELIKKRNLLKGASIGLGIVFLLALSFLFYLFFNVEYKKISIASFIPFFILPMTFIPIMINLSLINKEINSRKL